RDYFAEDDGEMVPRTSHTAAFLSDTKDRGPPVQSQIWRSGEKVPFVQTYSLRAFEKPPQVQTQALRDFEKTRRVCMIIKRLLKTKPLNNCVVLVGGARMLTPQPPPFFFHLLDLKGEQSCRAPQNYGVLSKGQPACMFPFIER
uniref:Phosphodiesterase 4D interacting protein n=1 Tax=Cercocebus atys TaxID=9531 RepID=A0A2K5LQC8_CERAT